MGKDMAKNKRNRWVVGSIAAVLVIAVAVLLLLFGSCGRSGGTDAPAQPQTKMDNWLVQRLEADGTDVIELNEDVELNELCYINGDKTITGSGTITMSSGGEYIIVINNGSSLTLAGPVLDGTENATNGIYVSENASLKISAGGLQNLTGHGIRVLGTADISGGSITGTGTNWVMVDTGAKLSVTGGSFAAAGEDGILTAADSETTLGSAVSMSGAKGSLLNNAGTMKVQGGSYTDAGSYAFHNEGSMEVRDVDFAGAKSLGYVENTGKLTLSGGSMTDSKADFVYNRGEAELSDVKMDNSTGTAIETRGTGSSLSIKNCTMDNIGKAAILSRNSVVEAEDLKIGTVGSYGIHNRASEFTGKNISIENAAEVAVYNDFAQDGDTAGCGKLTLDHFSIGTAGSYGLRNNGGIMTLTDGTVGKSGSYALYAKKGEVITNKVDFEGTLDTGKAVVQIGLSDVPGGTVTMNETTITGGARGITNNGTLTFNSGRIYGNVSGGSTTVGAGISNNESGKLYLNGGTITGNRASSSGGGVYNTGTAVIGAARITGNSSGASGGGIANKGSMTINGALVSNNYAANYGGGVFVNEGGWLGLNYGSVGSNTAGKGGGVAVSGSATISGGSISENTSNGAGGGLYVGTAGSVKLTGGNISDNKTGSENSGGGAYNLGKLRMSGGTISNNTAGSYGGGITNATNSAGTAHGTLTISGGNIKDNTSGKGGGGVYNNGEAAISGGSIKDNTPGTNGSAVYNSGTLTLTGGTLNGAAAGYEKKPYDLYIYKGTVSISDSPDFRSVYKTLDGHIKVTGSLTNAYNLYLNNYNLGTEALTGTTALISANKDKFLLPAEVTAEAKYINDDGIIVNSSYDPNAKEAELWRDGSKVATGNLVSILSDAKDGDVVKLISDVELSDCASISKDITITDDGTARTISFKSKDKAGIMTKDAEVTIEGTEAGGLTLKGGESTSAGVIINSDSTLHLSNVEVTGFHNTADSGASASMSSGTSGKNGAAFYLRSNSSAALTMKDVTITDCTTDNGGGAAVYNSEGGTVEIRDSSISGCTAAGTYGGGAVYNAGSAAISGSTLTGNSAACSGDTTRGDGGAVYNSSKGTAVINDTEITGNSAARYGGDVYNANALTVSGSDKMDEIYLTAGTSATLGGEFTGALGITVSDSDYVPDKAVLVMGSDASEEQLSAATEKVTILNDTSETPALILKEDGTLQENPAAAVEAFVYTGTDTSAEPAFKGSLVGALAEVQTGGTIVLQDDATTTAAITMGDFTLDGNGKTLTLGGSIEIGSAVTAAKVQNVTLAQTGSMSKAAIYNQGVTTLTSVTIDGCSFTASSGGALYNSKSLTVKDCVITNNTTATASGGGLFNGSKGTVVLSGSTAITGNTCGKNGNDIYNGNTLTVSGTVTVDELYLANDKSAGLDGEWTGSMGVKVADSSFVKDRVIITKGSATDAQLAAACEKITLLNNAGLDEDAITILLGDDGILCLKPEEPTEECEAYVYTGTDTTAEPAFKGSLAGALAEVQTGGTIVLQKDVTTSAAITMGDFTLDGNGKTLTLGGSIEIGSAVTAAKVQNVTLAQTGSMSKAAIYNQGVTTLTSVTINGCSFTASSGGALYNSKSLTVKDCVITNNTTATASGGGLFNGSKGTVVLSGSTAITGNTCGKNGNDIFNGNILTVSGTVTVGELYLANDKFASLGGEWTGSMGVKVADSSFVKGRVIITKDSATDAQLAAACEKITLLNNSGLAEDAITVVLDADAASETLGKLINKAVEPEEPEEPTEDSEAYFYSGTDTSGEPASKGSFADMFAEAQSTGSGTVVVRKPVTYAAAVTDLSGITITGNDNLTMTDAITVTGTVTMNSVKFSGTARITNNGTLTLSGCSFNGISGTSVGGAVNNAGTLTMSGGSITGCSTTSTTGGGAVFNKGTAILSGVSISGCSASAGNGGGICNNSAGSLTLNSCTISGNTKGSGKYGNDVYNANSLTVTGSTTIGELYLTSGKTIQVTSALSGSITLKVANSSYTNGATVLTGDAAAVAASAEKITLANSDYMVDTEGKIVPKLSTTSDDESGLMTMALNDEPMVTAAGDADPAQTQADTAAGPAKTAGAAVDTEADASVEALSVIDGGKGTEVENT